jgi:hypothetical protein
MHLAIDDVLADGIKDGQAVQVVNSGRTARDMSPRSSNMDRMRSLGHIRCAQGLAARQVYPINPLAVARSRPMATGSPCAM